MIQITRAIHPGGHLLLLFFNDGKSGCLNMHGYLKSSKNPLIRQYLDELKFSQFEVTPYSLHWENSLDISSETLYKQLFPT